jgi:4-amino-4-deoxy-L-arabinose transferase-like glycosyltransferase
LALAGLTAVALLFRFYRLGDLPPGLHYDETFDGLDAFGLLSTPLRRWPLFFTGNFGREPLFMVLLAASQALFGPTALSLRLVPALLGALLTPALVWLGWEMGPGLGVGNRPRFALWAGAGALALLWTQVFARYAIRIELFALIIVLVFAGLWRAWHRQQGRWWGVAGILAGLSFYTYLPARLLPLVFVPVGVWAVWRSRPALRLRLPGLTLAAVLALLVALPLALYFVRNPVSFATRTAQVSILGQGAGAILHNVRAILEMPLLAGDANPRYNLPGRPALDAVMALPFLVGLGLLVRFVRRPAALFLLSWLLVMLLPSLLSEHAPSFQRAIGAAPAFALILALGLESMVGWAARRWPRAELWWGRMGWAALAASTLFTWRSFGAWSASPELFFARDLGFAQLAGILGDDVRRPVYLSPRGNDHPTVRYLLLEDMTPPELHGFDGRVCVRLAAGAADYYFLTQEDGRGPALLASYLPDAVSQVVVADPYSRPWASRLRQPEFGRVHLPEMTPQPAKMGEGIDFLGFWLSATALKPGERLYVRLFWQSQAGPRLDYTTFVHLLSLQADGSFARLDGADAPPGNGSCATSDWLAAETIVDELQFDLPADLAPGAYYLAVGFYDPASGQRLSAPGHANDQIILGPWPLN